MFTSQMIVNGTVKPKEIVKAFGVPSITVKRYVKVFRDHGAKGFYENKPRRSSASVLKGAVLEQARALLEEGRSVPEVAREMKRKYWPTRCTKRSGRSVYLPVKKTESDSTAVILTKSERSQIDSQAPMGNATTRSLERVSAVLSQLERVVTRQYCYSGARRSLRIRAATSVRAIRGDKQKPEAMKWCGEERTRQIRFARQRQPLRESLSIVIEYARPPQDPPA